MKLVFFILIATIFADPLLQQNKNASLLPRQSGLLSNFFNGTHQIVVYQNLTVKFVQLVNTPSSFVNPQVYDFTNGTHILKIYPDGRTTITSMKDQFNFMTLSPNQQQQLTQQPTNYSASSASNSAIFSVSNGTHLITVYRDLTFKVVPLTNQQQNSNMDTTDTQMIFCSGSYELGIYGDGRIRKAPLFTLWQPPSYLMYSPVNFQKYVVSGFFNGTHRVTVFNDGGMIATPVYSLFLPVYYSSNWMRNQINNGTHDIRIYNSGRVEMYRLF